MTSPFIIIIPLALVYQFVVNKIYDIDFLLGRIRYYGFLSIVPTIGVVWLNILFDSKGNNFNIIQITVYVFLIFLAVFYIKELLDYKFRLKRFSEKYNYQDSIYKYTQLLKSVSALNQVFMNLKKTILDVLPVSKAYIFEINSDGDILYFDKQNSEPNWRPYKKNLLKSHQRLERLLK